MANRQVNRMMVNEAHKDVVKLKAVAHVRTDRPNDPTMLDILTAIRGIPHVITVKQEGSTRPAPENHQRVEISITFDDDHKYDVPDLERAARKIPGVRLFRVVEYEGKPYKPEMQAESSASQDLIAAVKEAIHRTRTASAEPYRDNQITENVRIRRFSESVRDEDLVWHRDERDRAITVLEGRGWQFQRDNELPREMRPGQVIEVRAGEWHRVIKGAGQLHTIILESKSVISEQSETETTPKEMEVEPPEQEVVPTGFKVEWSDSRLNDVVDIDVARVNKLTAEGPQDEKLVVACLNALSDDNPWEHVGGQKGYDIELTSQGPVTISPTVGTPYPFSPGKYEVKKKSGAILSRLGDAKSIPVRAEMPISALASIGSAFGNFERSLGATDNWPEGLDKDLFKVMTGVIRSRSRWESLATLSLNQKIMTELKKGEMQKQLENLRKGLLSYLLGSTVEEEEDGKVTIRAELPPEERDGKADYEAEIDLGVFTTRVKPYLAQKGDVKFDNRMSEEQYEALTEFYRTLTQGLEKLPDADGFEKLFDKLAEKTQTGTVEGIFAWNKGGFRFYKFQELTVKSMTYGRLVLKPKTKSDD